MDCNGHCFTLCIVGLTVAKVRLEIVNCCAVFNHHGELEKPLRQRHRRVVVSVAGVNPKETIPGDVGYGHECSGTLEFDSITQERKPPQGQRVSLCIGPSYP